MNGAYRHPALDARGVVCIAEAARITRDRPARPLKSFSAPVSQVALGTRRTALGRRRERADSFYFAISRPPYLRPRPACARTARSARPGWRVTQFGLQVPPIFFVRAAPLGRRSSQCD